MATYDVPIDGIGSVPISLTERGEGPLVLLLHGGAGPQSVTGFADLLAESERVAVITPTHPGFDGTSRPEALATIRDLARLYIGLLDVLGRTDVTIVGNSIGGWIAAEMALLHSVRVTGLALIGAVGIRVPGCPVPDFFALALEEIADYSYHDPDRFRIDPAALSDAQRAAMAGNRAALATYTDRSMEDPTLADRLATVTVETLVIAGAADRFAPPAYARAYAEAIPAARFEVLPETGHVPQLETPDRLLKSLSPFISRDEVRQP